MTIHKRRVSLRAKDRHKRTIRSVIKGLGRAVIVYKQPVKQECPNCYYDKFTDRSTGKCKWTAVEAIAQQAAHEVANPGEIRYRYFKFGRCPVCRGRGLIEIHRRKYVDCLVTWDPGARNNSVTYTPAGTEGSTIVQLKTDPKYYDLFKDSSKIVVDGVDCKISRPPTLRGLGVQAVLVISAFTTEKPKIDSGEIIKDYR
jgi:hypothetical protein